MLENTVYNKVYKTILHGRPKLVIPMINEIFEEKYTGQERIEFLEGTHYIKDTDGKLVERATDSYFKVLDEREKEFHLEAQSTTDTTMVQRVYEYDSAIAYKYRRVEGSRVTVKFPPSAVLFLRHTRNTPDVMEMVVEMKEGTAIQKIPVMKLGNYAPEDIFNKGLLILIPFHVFVYENKFLLYNKDEKELEKLKDVFRRMKEHLDMLVESGELDAYDRHFLISMTIKVVENLAEKFENVVKGVKKVMFGAEIEYMSREEFYRVREEGLAAGRNEGFTAGRSEGLVAGERKAYLALFRDGLITLTEVAKRLNMSEEMVKTFL